MESGQVQEICGIVEIVVELLGWARKGVIAKIAKRGMQGNPSSVGERVCLQEHEGELAFDQAHGKSGRSALAVGVTPRVRRSVGNRLRVGGDGQTTR